MARCTSLSLLTALFCLVSLNGSVATSFGWPLPPDTRPGGCKHRLSDPSGANFEDMRVSIIIPYKKEKLEHIRGTIESILHFTSLELVEEILFVSDGNSEKTIYEDEIKALCQICRILKFPPPGVGLISAKMRAVEATSNETSVLMFLEPHIRVNRQWLQPLLRRIRKWPQALVMPVLDMITHGDFNSYHKAVPGIWRFEWNLNLIYSLPKGGIQTWTKNPVLTPATSGGIFAIRKDWWNKLELYDEGMFGWGGDHIEATMKVWRCGGHIEMMPCSRVGHLFRDEVDRPYDVATERVVNNYHRTAKVWLDKYIDKFYFVKPEAKSMKAGNLSTAHALRQKLRCHDMKWYLENVDAEMNWEKDHICIPGCQIPNVCCQGPAHPGRSTIDRVCPRKLYKPPRLPEAKESWLADEVPELTGKSANDICLKGEGLCVIYLTDGKVTATEIEMLTELSKKFTSQLSHRGARMKFMWLNLALEIAFKDLFEPEQLPSAVVFNPHKRFRFSKLEHGDEGEVKGDAAGISKLVDKVLGGDARFKTVPGQQLPSFASSSPGASETQKPVEKARRTHEDASQALELQRIRVAGLEQELAEVQQRLNLARQSLQELEEAEATARVKVVSANEKLEL